MPRLFPVDDAPETERDSAPMHWDCASGNCAACDEYERLHADDEPGEVRS